MAAGFGASTRMKCFLPCHAAPDHPRGSRAVDDTTLSSIQISSRYFTVCSSRAVGLQTFPLGQLASKRAYSQGEGFRQLGLEPYALSTRCLFRPYAKMNSELRTASRIYRSSWVALPCSGSKHALSGAAAIIQGCLWQRCRVPGAQVEQTCQTSVDHRCDAAGCSTPASS